MNLSGDFERFGATSIGPWIHDELKRREDDGDRNLLGEVLEALTHGNQHGRIKWAVDETGVKNELEFRMTLESGTYKAVLRLNGGEVTKIAVVREDGRMLSAVKPLHYARASSPTRQQALQDSMKTGTGRFAVLVAAGVMPEKHYSEIKMQPPVSMALTHLSSHNAATAVGLASALNFSQEQAEALAPLDAFLRNHGKTLVDVMSGFDAYAQAVRGCMETFPANANANDQQRRTFRYMTRELGCRCFGTLPAQQLVESLTRRRDSRFHDLVDVTKKMYRTTAREIDFYCAGEGMASLGALLEDDPETSMKFIGIKRAHAEESDNSKLKGILQLLRNEFHPLDLDKTFEDAIENGCDVERKTRKDRLSIAYRFAEYAAWKGISDQECIKHIVKTGEPREARSTKASWIDEFAKERGIVPEQLAATLSTLKKGIEKSASQSGSKNSA